MANSGNARKALRERHPGKRKPTRPVVASEHKCPTDKRKELGEFDPDCLVLKRHQFPEVVSEADDAHRQVHASNDRHREGAFVRIHGSTSSTASLGSNSSACAGRAAPAS